MFFSSLNLALLSICFVSNNEIVDSGNLASASFNSQYGVYDVRFTSEPELPYVLRYDNQNLLYFYTYDDGNDNLVYRIEYDTRSNLNVWGNLFDDGYEDFPTNKNFYFDTLVPIVNNNEYIVYTDSYSTLYPRDSSPFWSLSIRLLSETAYTTNLDNQESYETGYNNGYNTGYNNGKTEGYNSGYDEGQTEGFTDGYDVGRTDGYTQGYNTALSTHDFSFTNLFASLSDTPVLMIRRLFGFEIFGVSLIAVFMSLFTALVIIKIIKKVF